MSSITDYFERNLRNEHKNPSSRWPLLALGITFLLVAAIVQIRNQDGARVAGWVVEAAGMIFYAATEMKLRRSKFYIPALLLSIALWFGGVLLIVRAYV